MRIVRFDSIGGASGDMLLGSLIELGADLDMLSSQLEALLPGHCELKRMPVSQFGLSGTQLVVNCFDHHERHCDHGHHAHHTFADIKKLISASKLPKAVIQNAIGVFQLLAKAEAAVHGTDVEQVAFHEVGAVDSIADIVGFCCAWEQLQIQALDVSPLPTGYGSVSCQHGVIPVPAPATAEILQLGKLEVYRGVEAQELLTPTGAALLSYFPHSQAAGKVLAAARVFGARKLQSIPNLLQSELLECNGDGKGAVWELAVNLDDLDGEGAGILPEMLLQAGALDAWLEPIYMKKNRPGIKLALLCREECKPTLAQLVLRHTGSFGLRMHRCERLELERFDCKVATAYGEISVKVGRGYGLTACKAEFSDCLKAAQAAQVPVKQVAAEAINAYRQNKGICC